MCFSCQKLCAERTEKPTPSLDEIGDCPNLVTPKAAQLRRYQDGPSASLKQHRVFCCVPEMRESVLQHSSVATHMHAPEKNVEQRATKSPDVNQLAVPPLEHATLVPSDPQAIAHATPTQSATGKPTTSHGLSCCSSPQEQVIHQCWNLFAVAGSSSPERLAVQPPEIQMSSTSIDSDKRPSRWL